MPSRKSPRRGSGRSPRASASASSGYRLPAASGSGNAPPKRGLTSVIGSEPSGSRKHWTFAGPTIPIVSATCGAVLDQLTVLEREALDRLAALRLDHRARDRIEAAALDVAEDVDRELLAETSLLDHRVDRVSSAGGSRAGPSRRLGRCGAIRSPRAPSRAPGSGRRRAPRQGATSAGWRCRGPRRRGARGTCRPSSGTTSGVGARTSAGASASRRRGDDLLVEVGERDERAGRRARRRARRVPRCSRDRRRAGRGRGDRRGRAQAPADRRRPRPSSRPPARMR